MPAERYFRCGDVGDLKAKMEILLERKLSEEEQQEIRNNIEKKMQPQYDLPDLRGRLG